MKTYDKWIIAAVLVSLLVLSGCATLTPEEQFIKEDRAASAKVDREEAQKGWDYFVAQCHDWDGVVVRSSRLSINLSRPPAKHESVVCMSKSDWNDMMRGW